MPAAKVRLLNYLETTTERVNAEGFDPDEEELKDKIMPSVVSSVKKLVAGAPDSVKQQFKAFFVDAAVIPDYEADLEAFRGALQACLELSQTQVPSEEDIESEQASDPAQDGGQDPDPTPTEDELATLTTVIARLWTIDEPFRMNKGEDFELNHQARAASLDSLTDRADAPLFTSVDRPRLLQNPCSSAFLSLLDNYNRDTDAAEAVTAEEQHEMNNFLRLVMKTPHMRYAHKVLVAWGKADPDPNKFAAQVFEIWFTQYRLQGRGPLSSSGFEHVFVGEEKDSSIVGLHNWIQFVREEKVGRINYRGYVGSLDRDDDRVVSVRFDWGDGDADVESKSVSTFLVGTSVAFEFSMLTLAFLGFDGEAKIPGIWFGDLGPYQITTYSWSTRLGKVVRTAFVEA